MNIELPANVKALPYPGGGVQPEKRKIKRLSDALKGRKPAEWIIHKYLPANSLIFLHAPPKVGKTFLAIDWALSIAAGRDWQGHRVKKKGAVLYVSGEGNNNILKRLEGWCIHHDIDPDIADLFVSEQVFRLPADRDEIIGGVFSAIPEHGLTSCTAVFLDTYRRTSSGDENSNADARAYIEAADDIKEKLGCSVIVVHHSNRGQDPNRMTGASSLLASADAVFRLNGNEQDMEDPRTLVNQAQKDAKLADAVNLAFKEVVVPDLVNDEGEPETTLVPVKTGFVELPRDQAIKAHNPGKNKDEALEILRGLYAGHKQTLNEGDYPDRQARVTVKKWKDACLASGKFNQRALRGSAFECRIRDKLAAENAIKVEGYYVYLVG